MEQWEIDFEDLWSGCRFRVFLGKIFPQIKRLGKMCYKEGRDDMQTRIAQAILKLEELRNEMEGEK